MQERIASEQSMIQDKMQAGIPATKAAIMTVMEAESPSKIIRLVPAMPKTYGPVLKQPMFDLKWPNKYI